MVAGIEFLTVQLPLDQGTGDIASIISLVQQAYTRVAR